VGDQALISYYNDSPATPTRIPLMDNVKQRITNLGFMLTANGSRKVDLNSHAAAAQGNSDSFGQQIFVARSSALAQDSRLEAYIFAEKFFQHDSAEF